MWIVYVFLTDSVSRRYDVTNDVMKSAILEIQIPNYDISRVIRSTACLILHAYCQGRF